MGAIKGYVLDLDGLLLDTECLVIQVAQQVADKYAFVLTPEVHKTALGKRPLDCWRDVGLPMAVATSTSRATFNLKMHNKQHVLDLFGAVVCGDEVPNGKPAPDVFLEAARQLHLQPEDCLVFEDAPSGVEGATAAGMRVVMVPSLVGCPAAYPTAEATGIAGPIACLKSLLDVDPTLWGGPPFTDCVNGVVPLDPMFFIRGTVVKGFGRGSRELGIPTANVDSSALHGTLAEAVTGIYMGWASVGESVAVHKMVMSIGWNPFFGNKEKTAEPWVLHDFDEPFYGQEIRLVVCGYIRPEANFDSLQALIDRIHLDAEVSKTALGDPRLALHAQHEFLKPLPSS